MLFCNGSPAILYLGWFSSVTLLTAHDVRKWTLFLPEQKLPMLPSTHLAMAARTILRHCGSCRTIPAGHILSSKTGTTSGIALRAVWVDVHRSAKHETAHEN